MSEQVEAHKLRPGDVIVLGSENRTLETVWQQYDVNRYKLQFDGALTWIVDAERTFTVIERGPATADQ